MQSRYMLTKTYIKDESGIVWTRETELDQEDIKMLQEGLNAIEASINLFAKMGPLAKKLKNMDLDENLLLNKHKKLINLSNRLEQICNTNVYAAEEDHKEICATEEEPC